MITSTFQSPVSFSQDFQLFISFFWDNKAGNHKISCYFSMDLPKCPCCLWRRKYKYNFCMHDLCNFADFKHVLSYLFSHVLIQLRSKLQHFSQKNWSGWVRISEKDVVVGPDAQTVEHHWFKDVPVWLNALLNHVQPTSLKRRKHSETVKFITVSGCAVSPYSLQHS